MSNAPVSHLRCIPGPAPLGAFVMGIGVPGSARGEWVAPITPHTDVVVSDVNGSPSPIGVAKALSIVQSRVYLERRAIQLLAVSTEEPGAWRLVTIDFGSQAQSHNCEFLMCFAFEPSNSVLSITSPYAEIGFALIADPAEDPLFILTVKTAVGLAR